MSTRVLIYYLFCVLKFMFPACSLNSAELHIEG